MSNYSDDENNDEKEQSFAAMLEAYSPGAETDMGVGDKIKGKIVSIGKDAVFVATGTKIDGVVDKAELIDENGELTLREGDTLELYIVALSDEEIKLSRALSGIGGLNMLKEAYAKSTPVEGKIIEVCKGGVRVEVLQRKAFCPVSQLDITYVENTSDYVGETHHFLISTFEEKGRNIVLSRRALLAREQEKARKEFYKTLTVGDSLDGTVTRIMPYGAFVQLSPGVEGMVHISEMSWSKAATSASIVKVDDIVRVKVIGLESDKKPGMLKISLSMKQLSEDPWLGASEKFHQGDKIQGTVTRCAKFGAFVEVAPGIEGLVHISEMSYTQRVLKPEDVVAPGETVSVMIKDVDLDKRRLSLSIRDAAGDPWIGITEKYKIGQSVEGLLEKKEKFGYFINLEPGITGLLPKSNLNKAGKPAEIEKLKEGDTIAVMIDAINTAERKITLTPTDTAEEQNWQSFSDTSADSLGALGEKLQRAMNKKKSD